MIDPEKLKEAFDLAGSICEDLADEQSHPTVVDGMSLSSAIDNTQQLLDMLTELKAESLEVAA